MNLTVTDKASRALSQIVAEHGANLALRLSVQKTGCCGYEFDMGLVSEAEPGDFVFDANGLRLVVDRKSEELLEGAVIDFDGDVAGGGITIHSEKLKADEGCCAC